MGRGGSGYNSSTDLYVMQNKSLTNVRYMDDILDHIVRPYTGTVDVHILPIGDNIRPHRARDLSTGIIERMGLPTYFQYCNYVISTITTIA